MSDSILTSVKKQLGLEADDPSFDPDVIMLINSAILTLTQLGVGPPTGFMIEDAAATWEDLLGADLNLNAAKTFVYLKVRIVFDPPANANVMTALEKQIEQFEWRISVNRETTMWTSPTPPVLDDDPMGDPLVIDGGVG